MILFTSFLLPNARSKLEAKPKQAPYRGERLPAHDGRVLGFQTGCRILATLCQCSKVRFLRFKAAILMEDEAQVQVVLEGGTLRQHMLPNMPCGGRCESCAIKDHNLCSGGADDEALVSGRSCA